MSIAIPTAGIGNSPGTQIGQGPNAEVVFQDSPCGVHAAHAMNARAGGCGRRTQIHIVDRRAVGVPLQHRPPRDNSTTPSESCCDVLPRCPVLPAPSRLAPTDVHRTHHDDVALAAHAGHLRRLPRLPISCTIVRHFDDRRITLRPCSYVSVLCYRDWPSPRVLQEW